MPLTFLLTFFLLFRATAEKKPNFLFIIVDDQSPLDLKIYNPRSILDTPNIDRLAKEGMGKGIRRKVRGQAGSEGGSVGGTART